MANEIPELDKLLGEVLNSEHDGGIMLQQVLNAIAEKAAKGDLKAAEMLLERAYGKIGVGDSDTAMAKWNGALVCTDEQFNQLLEAARNGATKGDKGE